MNSTIYFSFFVLLYLFIGYKVAICRYRFAHSEAAKTDAWSKKWQAFVFYPITLFHMYTDKPQMRRVYEKALGSDRYIIASVFDVKPSTYILCMTWFWLFPFIATIIIWIVVGVIVFLIMCVFKPIGTLFMIICRCVYRGLKFILPADLKKLEDDTESLTVTTE